MRSLINRAGVVVIDELRRGKQRDAARVGQIHMQEIVLTSDLGSKLTIKAEHSIDDHFVLQINDLGYHLPQEAADGLIDLLEKVARGGRGME